MNNRAGRKRQCYVYCILAEELNRIKIGYSEFPYKRLSEIANMSPVPVCMLAMFPGDKAEEDRIHNRFSKDRLHGEWFRATSELHLFIQERHLNGGMEYADELLDELKELRYQIYKQNPSDFLLYL